MPKGIVLSTCRLRPFGEGDQRSIARHANHRQVWIGLRDRFPHPDTPADADAWFRQVADCCTPGCGSDA